VTAGELAGHVRVLIGLAEARTGARRAVRGLSPLGFSALPSRIPQGPAGSRLWSAQVEQLPLRSRREIGGLVMRPDLKDADHNARLPRTDYRQDTAVEAGGPAPSVAPNPTRSPRSASESGLNERLGRLLLQKRGPDAVMLVVLSLALFFGLIGLAVHFLWIVAIIVMALGLGFVVADSRRDRIDIANRRTEEAAADRM